MLKKLFLINIAMFSIALAGYCFSEEQLSKMEIIEYGQSYPDESIASRLNRLETDYFGMVQSGDIDSRIDMLKRMSNNSKRSAILLPEDNYYPGEKRSAMGRFWDNVTDTFSGGTVTGFTPGLDMNSYGYSNSVYGNGFNNFFNNLPYCPYHNRYHNNNFFNRAYRNINRFANSGFNYNYPNFNRHYYGRNHYNRPYSPYYGPYRRMIPQNNLTNLATRSSVHIIKD